MEEKNLPRHVGYIVDGNRRWAKMEGISKDVHRKGADVVFDVARKTIKNGVEFATFYVFSTENWGRAKKEVDYLMGLFVDYFHEKLEELKEEDVRVVFLGTKERLSPEILDMMGKVEDATSGGKNGTIGFCFNYGGHQEIADAVRKVMKDGAEADDVTPELIAENIYHPEIPPVDIVVRTGGELRLSNFMLWRAAYSELLFLEKLWPEMTDADVDEVLEEYARRNRRFGH
jgi:undecaprenyl diphosphate synthase